METRSARLLRKGDIISHPDITDREDVVRDVVVVVRLASGESLTFSASDLIEVADKEDLSDLQEEIQSDEYEE